jgi:hypothetical protein
MKRLIACFHRFTKLGPLFMWSDMKYLFFLLSVPSLHDERRNGRFIQSSAVMLQLPMRLPIIMMKPCSGPGFIKSGEGPG